MFVAVLFSVLVLDLVCGGGFGGDLAASAYVRCFSSVSTLWPKSLILMSCALRRLRSYVVNFGV